jgi:hypothetical protein
LFLPSEFALVAIGSKNKSVTFLLAGARNGLPLRIDKLCGIPGAFVFTCRIGCWGWSRMSAVRIFLVAIGSKNKSVAFLLAGARNGLPLRIDKLRGIPGAFVLACRICL